MGLFFGATGIVMNHRAVLALPLKKVEQSVAQLPLARTPASADELARLLAARVGMSERAPRIRVEPARTVVWDGRELREPPRWRIELEGAQRSVLADYWVGNRFVEVRRAEANWIGTLTRLHMAIGVDAIWVLVADSIAGSLILLSLTGLALWTELRAWRVASVAVSLGAASLALWRALAAA